MPYVLIYLKMVDSSTSIYFQWNVFVSGYFEICQRVFFTAFAPIHYWKFQILHVLCCCCINIVQNPTHAHNIIFFILSTQKLNRICTFSFTQDSGGAFDFQILNTFWLPTTRFEYSFLSSLNHSLATAVARTKRKKMFEHKKSTFLPDFTEYPNWITWKTIPISLSISVVFFLSIGK